MFNHPYILIEKRKGERDTSSIIESKIQELGWNPKHNIRDYINKIINT